MNPILNINSNNCQMCIKSLDGGTPCNKEDTCMPLSAALLFVPVVGMDDVRKKILAETPEHKPLATSYFPPSSEQIEEDFFRQKIQSPVETKGIRTTANDGSTADYYELPINARQLQDLISFLNCNAQLGEIGRAWYRYGRCAHSEKRRDLRKIIFYARAELDRLNLYEQQSQTLGNGG